MKFGIRPRLLTLTGTLMVLLWVVLGLAWSNGQASRARLDTMFNTTLKARTTARDLQLLLSDGQATLLGLIWTTDPTLRASREKDLRDNTQAIEDRFRQLQQFDDGTAVDKPFETARKNWESFRDIRESELLPMIKAGDQQQEVFAVVEGKQRDLRKSIETAIDQIADYHVQRSQAQVVEATTEARSAETLYMAFIAASVLIGGIALWFVGRVSAPVRQLAVTASRIAEGEIDQTIDHRSADELGQLASAFRDMIRYIGRLADAADKVGKGDLTVEITPLSSRDTLSTSFAQMVASLKLMVGRTSAAVASITGSTNETLASVRELSTSATGQAAAVSETTSTVEELRQSGDEVAERSKSVADLARRSAEAAEAGRRTIEETVAAMKRIADRIDVIARAILALSEQTQAVGKITATVNDIAEQSKMLAFNAAIEAAKAGEYGKGFAVVATEIRTLADQSKQATSQIADILTDIQKASNQSVMVTEEGTRESERGMQLANQSGEKIREIAEAIRSTAQNAMQIESATLQQSRGMDQIAQAMASVSSTASQTQAAGSQMERAMQDLNALADQLKASVAAYRLGAPGTSRATD